MAQMKKAPRFNSKKEVKKPDRPVYDYDVTVDRVLDGKYGTLFDMTVNHVKVYGCRVCETREGEAFVGFPQKKGKRDDRYWSIVYAPFTKEQTADILRKVEDKLEEQEGEEAEE